MDDSATWAFLVQQMLEAGGHEVLWAGDGAAGYGTYLLFRPDLVITDIEMPEKSGLEMAEHIRKHNPAVEIIYMSVDADRFAPRLQEEQRNFRAGLLRKPFSRLELMKIVAAYDSKTERRREQNG